MAVSACADKSNLVAFDREGSCILSGQSPEIYQIRTLLAQAVKKVKVERTGGTYSFRMWRMPKAAGGDDQGFTGWGKR